MIKACGRISWGVGLGMGAENGQVVAVAGEIGAGGELVVGEQGTDVVAVRAVFSGFVGLEDVGEAEEAPRAGPVPDQVVEGAEELGLLGGGGGGGGLRASG